MSPKEPTDISRHSSCAAGEEIVISGISGRFPESVNFKEFQDNLFGHVNMVTVNDRRFKAGLHGIPEGFGALVEIDKFDAEFFKVLPGQTNRMDPQLRIAMETTYEAMVDAGVNPSAERGSRTGVFFATCFAEGFQLWNQQPDRVQGVTMTGTTHSMFANRISYAFDFKGPSACYDTACSSSIYALEAAVSAIRAGKCDSAMVVASSLILSPHTNMQFNKLGMLTKDSKCKSFDESGDGYVRSETVATIYLQKASVAKRAYATIVHVKTNTDGYKDGGITYPSTAMQRELIMETITEAGVHPDQITYIEAHGTGTAAGDPSEVLAISKVFNTKTRSQPLLIGSVKSNMGHSEGASGLNGIAKLLTILQTGTIPANLHYQTPNFKLNSIRNGLIRVVDKNTKWEGGYLALNSFGFGGVNTHLILKPKNTPGKVNPQAPQLVLCSGRTEEGVTKMLKEVGSLQDPHMAILLNEVNKTAASGLNVRGYSLWASGQVETASDTEATNSGADGRPWFVFNGMGSQWVGMGRSMLQIPAFKTSIGASAVTLKKHVQFDLMKILEEADEDAFSHPTNVFVSIAAVQIALVDTLAAVGIKPAGVVGHSAGEMLCAYADECLTAEQTVLAAYWRGHTLEKLKNVKEGADEYGMAAVGLSWSEAKKLAPEGVHAACHNGAESVTLSGPKSKLQEFVKVLKEKKKMATEVASCGVAFHSPYISAASDELRTILRNIIPKPLARSETWISSSVPEKEWVTNPLARTLSADYIVNNFLSPVLFYDAVRKIPEGATIIEVGPSGLLKGLIKRAAPKSAVIPLQSRDSKDGAADFGTALGKLFLAGVNFDANKLTDGGGGPKFPVPVSTPSLSPLVRWSHETSWDVPTYGKNGEFTEGFFDVNMAEEEHSYLTWHTLQGRVLYPAMGYVALVWKFFAQMHQAATFESFPVVFKEVRFNRVTVLGPSAKIEFRVYISEASGAFEIVEGGAVICTGYVRKYSSEEGGAVEEQMPEAEFCEIEKVEGGKLESMERPVESEHIYKNLRFYGYEYTGVFRGIQRSDKEGTAFQLAWNGNWVAFLDTLLQAQLRCFSGRQTQTELPTEVGKLVLNPERLKEYVANNPGGSVEGTGETEGAQARAPVVFTKYNPSTGLVKCRGVEMSGVGCTAVSSVHHREPAPSICTYAFTPYFDDNPGAGTPPSEGVNPILQCVSIFMENLASRRTAEQPTICQLTSDPVTCEAVQISNLIRSHFSTPDIEYTLFAQQCPDDLISTLARHHIVYKSLGDMQSEGKEWLDKKLDLIIVDNPIFLKVLQDYLKKGSFIILKADPTTSGAGANEETILAKVGSKINIVAKKVCPIAGAGACVGAGHTVYLLRKVTKQDTKNVCALPVSCHDLSWVPKLAELLKKHEEIEAGGTRSPLIYLISNGDGAHDAKGAEDPSGILGLLLSLRKEPFTGQLRAILAMGAGVPLDFTNPNPLLARILAADLAINVIDEEGRWGFYLHSPINPKGQPVPTDKAFVGMGNVGDLTTMGWVQSFDYDRLGANTHTPVDVHFASLNFKDVMLATGNLQPDSRHLPPYPIESHLGFEFSGVTSDGIRVFGYNEGQGLATHVAANKDSLWDIPEGWSFEDAATVPVVYATVYLALCMRGQMMPGDSVLIHAGAGGVGQAAIRVALAHGCQVFTTVGAKEKRIFIQTEFPQIPESHIGSTRDTGFERIVMEGTAGRGVDIVLNSLIGDKLEASVRCLARHGRFLEIGKVDLVGNKALGMALFLKDASFHGVMLDSLWDARPETRLELKRLMQEGIEQGVVVPLPRRVYRPDQVEPAFRFMGQGRHIGKILIQIRPENSSVTPVEFPASARVYFDPKKSYIIIGGLGGFGLELANWMTTRYAKNLVLTSRSGVKDAYQEAYLARWKVAGVRVKVLTLDASTMENARALVDQACAMGPLGGFFNLAMLLRIGLMTTQTEDDFKYVLSAKVDLTLNLDTITSAHPLCSALDHFVVFSSVASGFGFDGQSNYGMANSALERICERRVAQGRPGKAIQWGPIGDVGGWHEHYNKDYNRVNFHGSGVQSIYSALRSLDVLMSHPAPVMLSRRLMDVDLDGTLVQELTVVERIAHILGHANLSKVSPKSKLTELGLDSVKAVEVKQVLEQDFGLMLSATEIRSCTLEQLTDMSKNSGKNRVVGGPAPKKRAATADLFQLNFMRMGERSMFQEECVHKINELSDKSRGTVFICNSIEGPEILRILAGALNRPAYSMQMLVVDMPMESVAAMTDYYYKQLKATEPEGPYIIVGYSAGVIPAIEMAIRLHAEGSIQKLVLMDMSPARMDAIFVENFGTDRSKVDENDIITGLLSQVFNMDRDVLDNMLKSAGVGEERVKKVAELMGSLLGEPMDSDMMKKFLARNHNSVLGLINGYQPSGNYGGQTVLVRTTQNLIDFDSTPYWGLEQFCGQTPSVVTLNTTHSYMVAEPAVHELAATINE